MGALLQGSAIFGESIANAINQYHKEHVAYDQKYKFAESLSRMGYDPATHQITEIGPDSPKGIQPIVNPKTLEMFQANTREERSRSAGALDALGKIGMQTLYHQVIQAPTYPVTIGSKTYPLTAPQAATVNLQQDRLFRADAAAAAKAKADARAENRAERRTKVAEVGVDIRKAAPTQKAAQKAIETAPETKFTQTYGLPPQVLLDPKSMETGYTGIESGTGKTLGDISPLGPGQKLKDYPQAPQGWERFWQRVALNKPPAPDEISHPVEFIPKPGGAYREGTLKYPSYKGSPGYTQISPHPEGEFLRIGDNRIKWDDATKIRALAVKRQADALDALKQGLPLETVKKRLQTLGYNPDDPFFKLP